MSKTIDRIYSKVYTWLEENPGLIGILWSAWQGFGAHQGSALAAAYAYYALFSLFPLVLFAIALSSFFVSPDVAQEFILSAIANFLPAANDLIRDNIRAVLSARGTVGLLAAITFLWSASGVFGTIILAANRAWGITQSRPFWQSRALVLGVTAVAGLFLSLSLLSPFVLGFLQALNGALRFHLPGGTRLMTTLFTLAFGIATFTIIYALAPNTQVTRHSVLPGAVLVAVGWEIGKELFAWYLKSGFARFSLVYGSLGAVITLLLWAYLSGMIVVLGAELNAAIGRRQLKQVRQQQQLAGRLDQWADEGSHY